MTFEVLARNTDGTPHTMTVEASCFQEAEGAALRELPPGSVVTDMFTETHDYDAK